VITSYNCDCNWLLQLVTATTAYTCRPTMFLSQIDQTMRRLSSTNTKSRLSLHQPQSCSLGPALTSPMTSRHSQSVTSSYRSASAAGNRFTMTCLMTITQQSALASRRFVFRELTDRQTDGRCRTQQVAVAAQRKKTARAKNRPDSLCACHMSDWQRLCG